MNKKWMPIVAGIFEIIAGFWMLFSICVSAGVEGGPDELHEFLLLSILLILGLLAVVGGIFALIRRKWRLAFAGAIATLPLFLVAQIGLRMLEDYPYYRPTPPIFYLNLVSPLLLSIVIIALLILSKRRFK